MFERNKLLNDNKGFMQLFRYGIRKRVISINVLILQGTEGLQCTFFLVLNKRLKGLLC